jgi:hypothetical protein
MSANSPPIPWNEKKKKLRDRYPQLKEKDVIYQKGKEEQLISHLQIKLNMPRGKIKQILKSL